MLSFLILLLNQEALLFNKQQHINNNVNVKSRFMKLRSFKIFTVILLILCFFSCEEKEDTAKAIEEIDATAPTISVSEIAETIEVLTSIDISVSDNTENVNTTISINGNNVFTTSQNQFSYDFDPFEFRNGATNLVVTAIDEDGNETVKTFQFSLSKLLYKHDYGMSNELFDFYLAINKMGSGELVTSRQIIDNEDLVFYADDDFEKENLVITEYQLGKNSNFHVGNSQAGLKPGTVRLTSGERNNILGLAHDGIFLKNQEFALIIEEQPDYHYATVSAFDYSSSILNENTYKILYNSEMSTDVFLYFKGNSHINLLEDYRYFYNIDFSNQTINFNNLNRLSEEMILSFSLPDETVNYSFSLFGYSNLKSYQENFLRLLYGDAGNTSTLGFIINYPYLREYEILKKTVKFELDDGRIVLLERKNNLNVEIPNWVIHQTDNVVSVNESYDYLTFGLKLENLNDGNSDFFTRSYITNNNFEATIPFDNIEIPMEVVEFLDNKGFNVSSDQKSGVLSLELTNYENDLNYKDNIKYFPLGNEYGDVTSMTFPLNN